MLFFHLHRISFYLWKEHFVVLVYHCKFLVFILQVSQHTLTRVFGALKILTSKSWLKSPIWAMGLDKEFDLSQNLGIQYFWELKPQVYHRGTFVVLTGTKLLTDDIQRELWDNPEQHIHERPLPWDHLSWKTKHRQDLHFTTTEPVTGDHVSWEPDFCSQLGGPSRQVLLYWLPSPRF